MIDFVDLFSGGGSAGSVLVAIKYVILIAEALYGIFAFVVVRQVALMSKAFKTEFAGFFKLISYVHFLTVVAVFILSLILL